MLCHSEHVLCHPEHVLCHPESVVEGPYPCSSCRPKWRQLIPAKKTCKANEQPIKHTIKSLKSISAYFFIKKTDLSVPQVGFFN